MPMTFDFKFVFKGAVFIVYNCVFFNFDMIALYFICFYK
jgi:hypothetical protein